jgi:hypothetical protein
MNILYLSPNFPPNFYLFVQALAARGGRVLGILDTPVSGLRSELRDSLHDTAMVSGLHGVDEVLGAVKELIEKHGSIHRVESHLETWLVLESQIRQEFGIPGIQGELGRLKRKSGMKTMFRDAGVPSIRGEILKTSESGRAFIEKSGFPIIIKPDIGVGAQDTHKITSDREFEAFLSHRKDYDYFMEEFVKGDILTFDGLTDADGEVVFNTSHQYSADMMRIGSESLDYYYYNFREVAEDLKKHGLSTLKTLGIKEKFFHFEFFRTPEGKIISLEVNVRPPGGFTTDMFNYAHDMDVYDLWAGISLGQEINRDIQCKYHCAHVCRRERYQYRYTEEEVLTRLGSRLCVSQEMNPLYAKLMGEWAYLIRSESLEEIRELAGFIHAKA